VTATEVSVAVIVFTLSLLTLLIVAAFAVEAWRELGAHEPRHAAPRPQEVAWEPRTDVLPRVHDGTGELDPVSAEIETWETEDAVWRPWELATGEFPAIIDRLGVGNEPDATRSGVA
jgi:hypothetical protein